MRVFRKWSHLVAIVLAIGVLMIHSPSVFGGSGQSCEESCCGRDDAPPAGKAGNRSSEEDYPERQARSATCLECIEQCEAAEERGRQASTDFWTKFLGGVLGVLLLALIGLGRLLFWTARRPPQPLRHPISDGAIPTDATASAPRTGSRSWARWSCGAVLLSVGALWAMGTMSSISIGTGPILIGVAILILALIGCFALIEGLIRLLGSLGPSSPPVSVSSAPDVPDEPRPKGQ